jgi:hypothetical protein
MGSLRQALPIAVSMFGIKAISKQADRIPGLSSALGAHAGPVVAVAMIPVSAFLAKRVKPLRKYKGAIAVGAGLNALDVVLRAYMPADVKNMLGMGQDGIYAEMGDYVEIGQYTEELGMGDYVEIGGMGDYVEIGDTEGYSTSLGAEEDLGLMQELGEEPSRMQSFSSSQIGSGIGTPRSSGFVKKVPAKTFAKPVPSRSFVKAVPEFTSNYDNPKKLYTGNFAGGFGC